MNKYTLQLLAAVLFLLCVPAIVDAQETAPPSNAPAYAQGQIDQMLAPIALYPDPLVAQVLMASTYPLEVVEANRWLQDPKNASLKGDQLAAALEQQPWDPSVKSLVPFPQVLQMMDKNLQWTEQLGDAFLAQQPAVMDAVQHLRSQAQAAGNLQSTPQQAVQAQGSDIVIEPANPQVVYVPYYNPSAVYGAWPYPDYPPYYFPPPPGFVYFDEGLFGFGIGLAIIAPFWGWDHWDWGHHRIDIDDNRFRRINHDRPPIASGVWRHDPAHRGGVPYHSAATRAQFQGASEQGRRSYRGYSAVTAPRAERGIANTVNATSAQHEIAGRTVRPNPVVNMRERNALPMGQAFSREPVPRVTRPTAAPMVQRSAPIFESLSHGADARTYSARGASSRAAAVPARTAGRGNAHGGERGGEEKRR